MCYYYKVHIIIIQICVYISDFKSVTVLKLTKLGAYNVTCIYETFFISDTKYPLVTDNYPTGEYERILELN